MPTSAAPKPHPDYAVRALNPERLAAILAHAGQEVLDVGCGNGAYVLHLADRLRIRGVDYQQFDAWSARPELFGVSDAQRLDLPDGAVDTILSFETLEHLPDPARAMAEYFRVCRRNVILTVPNCELTSGMRGSGLIYNHWIDRTHVNFWDLQSIAELARSCGFRVRVMTHINRINLSPFLAEALGLDGSIGRIVAKFLKRRQRRQYPMTCLVVAEKASSEAPAADA